MKNFISKNKSSLLTIGIAASLITVVTAVAILLNEIPPTVIL